jgi:Carboxypeptidase regulatory-like domain
MNAVSRLSLIALIALLSLADALAAQTPRSRSQRVDPLTASIRGRITTADTGAPIRGAEVRLSMDGRFSRLVTTNGEGRYELRNLPAGVYKLIVSRTGFISLEFGQRRPFETASTITVGEGQSATGNVALIRGGAIFGRVLDQFGDPSVGTRVQVLRVRMEDGRRRLIPVGAGDQTDDTGAFRVYGLPPGDYYVSASTGLIDAVKRDPPAYYPGTMNFAEAQPITLGVGAEASADFQIVEAVRTARISGVVLNSSGVPIAAQVNLRSETINLGPSSESALQLHDDAAADGTFSIQNVPPGPYTLTAMVMPMMSTTFPPFKTDEAKETVRERMMNQLPETAAMPIVVSGENVSGITLATRRGGRVQGRFVADTGVVRPLPSGLHVTLRSAGPGGASLQMSGGSGNDADFQLAGVSGPTRAAVQGVPDGWAVKAILLDGDDVTDDAFDLAGKTGTLRVVMTDRLTSLSGTIQSNSNIRDHNVIVFPDEAAKWTFPSRFVRTVRADDEGRFRIEGLPPERYLAAALDYLEDGAEQDRQLLERLRTRATAVTLGEGEQRSIQLDVIGR